MSYASRLRRLLVGFQPKVEHLYLLEPFQVQQMMERLDVHQVSALVRLDPTLRRVLATRYPPMREPVDTVLRNHSIADLSAEDLLWEIADLLVYNIAPDLFDAVVPAPAAEVITALAPLQGTVADVGAGTGRLALSLARKIDTVYAVEPVGALRRFIREQRDRLGFGNLFTVDGFLHDLPFPTDSLDGVVTRSSLGWRLKAELAEIDRVLHPDGYAVHLTGLGVSEDAGPLHKVLAANGYRMELYREGRAPCRAYVKGGPSADSPAG